METKTTLEMRTASHSKLISVSAVTITGLYITVSILWILFFDQVLLPWFSDSEQLFLYTNAKYLAFSAITALFLYALIQCHSIEIDFIAKKLCTTENENRQMNETTQLELMERELVEEALRSSRTRYQQLFEHMMDGFSYQQIITDESGRPVDFVFLEINCAFEKILNLKQSQVIGQRAGKIFPMIQSSHADLLQLFGTVALTGQDNRFDYYWENTRRWFSIAAYSPQPGYFVTLFEDITKRKEAESKIKIQSEYLRSLNEVTFGLMNRLKLDELLSVIVARATSLLSNSSGSLYLPCDDGLNVKLVAASGAQLAHVGLIHRKDRGLVHQVMSTCAPVVLKDYQRWEQRLDISEFDTARAIVGLPLFADDRVYGVLQVEFYQPGRQFSEEEVEVLNRYARLASIALDNALLYKKSLTEIKERQNVEEKLKHMALHDGLTNLYNRSYFEEELHRLDRRRSGAVGIIICDVDGLKLVNDTLGHATGDQLLINVAEILRQSFRESDVIARIGGDEFAVLLFNASLSIMEKGIDRIRANVKQLNEQSKKSLLSFSSGWALSNTPADSLGNTFKEADANMYRKKLHQSRSNRSAMVKTLIQSMESKDYLTDGHADRLQKLAVKLASALRLPAQTISSIQLLAKFHDLGKVGIPDTLLTKEGKLTETDLTELHRHPEIGYRIAQAAPELLPIADFILKHHEWWDGNGYPFGLAGESIPIECRILSIIDAFDAMTNHRPYRETFSIEKAHAELKRCAGTQFDPVLVDLFISLQPPQ
ncbi:MAG: diguanylate cyclase domain protein [Firmicutes bacterium]|nr:diguanylate cyclase domain protein [Bacillota bacterium]